MFELLIVAVVVLIGVVSYRGYRERQANKQMLVITPPPANDTPGLLTRSKNWIVGTTNSVRDKIGRQAQPDVPKLLLAWAAESLSQNKGLQSWITSRTDKGAQALTEQLVDFCNNLNLDLLWLLNKGLDKDVALKQSVEQIVIAYCTACWKAAEAQDDLKTYQTILSLQENPNKKENRALSQAIFTELVKRDLAPAAKPELFLASDKDRQTHVMEAIQKAADKDRRAFNNVVSTVVFNTTSAVPNKPESEVSPVTAA